MRIKVFDVVKLNNGSDVIIKEILTNNKYKAEIFDKNGKSKEVIIIKIDDIKSITYSK